MQKLFVINSLVSVLVILPLDCMAQCTSEAEVSIHDYTALFEAQLKINQQGGHPKLMSSIHYLIKCEIWSQSPLLFSCLSALDLHPLNTKIQSYLTLLSCQI